MIQRIAVSILCVALGVLPAACATKKFVREQVGTSETKLGQRVDTQGTQLTQRLDTQESRIQSNTQAIDATGQKVQGLDTRVGEVQMLAVDAKKGADAVGSELRETQTDLLQRIANRNKYSEIQTKSIYFDFNKSDLKDEGINELRDITEALRADPNALLELRGFADPRGGDRYNNQLTRERVDAVVRYLVQQGVDLRRIHAVGMGKELRAAGEKASRENFAKSRRVEVRLLAPQS